MKTMKLLPLKIAVTSAMIIGLGAASTANAQAQSGLTYLEQARGLVDYHYNNYEGLKGLDLKGLNNNNVSSELKKKGLELNRELNKFKTETFTNQQLHVAAMEELGESIDDLYEANEENVERIVTIDHAAAANRQNIQDLAQAQLYGATVMEELNKNVEANKADIAKNKDDIKVSNGKIENLRTLFETRGRTVENNEKSVKENKDAIAKNKADIQDLAQAQLYGATVMEELNKNVEANKADIAKNNESIDDLYEANNENVERLTQVDNNVFVNRLNIKELERKQENDIKDVVGMQNAIAEQADKNTADIAANKADADAKFVGVQTDIANNKSTLAEHAKKINDNQQAIEAKLGGKADLQKLSELKSSVDKNQADIQLHDTKITNLATLFSWTTPTIGNNTKGVATNKADIAANKTEIAANKDSIAKNKAEADENFETLTKNQNALAEQNETINQELEGLADHANVQDTLIAANKNAIEQNVNRTAVNSFEIEKNKTGIAQNKNEIAANKADVDTKINNLRTLHSTVAGAVGNNTQGVAANKTEIAANKDSIAKNKAEADENFETLTKNQNALAEQNETINQELEGLADHANVQDTLIAANKNAIEQNVNRTVANGFEIEKNTAGIAKNQADIAANKADADAKFKGVQTDIANNKITLAQHAKKIDDNQQAIEAKLGGKADLQKLAELKTSVDKNQAGIQLHDQKINNLGILHTMVARAVGNNTQGVATNKADIAKNNESIEDLYEANAENVERLTQVDNNVFVNRLNIKELERKQENDIKDVVGMQNAIAEQADKNKNHIQDLAKAQLAGVEVMDELNKNVEKNKADADANFETLTKNQNALIEKDKAQDTLIAKNKADADASFETLTKNQNALIEKDKAQDTLIAKNKADADAKFTGVQTDIANNKTTLAQHAKKINDNQQAIEAKLGGKADAQALNSLNDKVNGFDGRISALDTKVNAFDGRITALDSKVENGMAAQAALSGLFQPYSVGKFNATAALGGYGSKSAVAIGAGYRVNPNLAIKAGAAINTSGDKKGSYNIGVNYEF